MIYYNIKGKRWNEIRVRRNRKSFLVSTIINGEEKIHIDIKIKQLSRQTLSQLQQTKIVGIVLFYFKDQHTL